MLRRIGLEIGTWLGSRELLTRWFRIKPLRYSTTDAVVFALIFFNFFLCVAQMQNYIVAKLHSFDHCKISSDFYSTKNVTVLRTEYYKRTQFVINTNRVAVTTWFF